MSTENIIPDGWKETTLGELAQINPRESLIQGTIAINIPMDCLDSFSKKIQKYSSKAFTGGTKFRNGDVLLARITPCLENGKTAFVDILNENEVGFGSTEYIVIREIKNKSDKEFLFYFSISPRFREVAIKAMTGTSGRQRVQTEMLVNHKFYLPPLSEQKSISSILTSFDDKIELLQAQNKTLEATAQTLFKEWFGKYQIGDTLPHNWKVGKLSETGKILCGKTPSKSNDDYFGVDTLFIKIPDMHNQMFIIKTIDKLSNLGANSQSNKMLPKNSICISCIATVGLVSITTENSQTNQQINSIVPNSNIYREFLYFSLTQMNKYLNDLGSGGTATLNVNTSTFSNIKLIIPEKNKLKEFHEQQEPLFEKIFSNLKQIQTLTKNRDTLLPKLMSGKIRVKE